MRYVVTDKRLTPLEVAVVRKMLADNLREPHPSADPADSMVVEDRTYSNVGFMTSLVRNCAAKLFADGMSVRWGKVVGCLNSEIDVDFVVYVDNGYLTCIEGATFGQVLWPDPIEHFEIKDI